MKLKKMILIVALVVFGLLLIFVKMNGISPLAWGIHSEIHQATFSNIAIRGYDPVSYFTKKKAVVGDKAFSYTWKDSNWYFSSEENKALFEAHPEKYSPQYGGCCAFAVSKGFTAYSNPNSMQLLDGKLYFSGDEDVKKDWIANYRKNVKQGDENWSQ